MKKFIFLYILCLSVISCKTADRLDVLDKTLDSIPQYEATFRRDADSLKVQYSLAGCDSVRFRSLTLRWKYPTFAPEGIRKGKKTTPLKQHYDMSTEEVIKFKDIETGDEIFYFNVSDMVIHKVEVYNTLRT